MKRNQLSRLVQTFGHVRSVDTTNPRLSRTTGGRGRFIPFIVRVVYAVVRSGTQVPLQWRRGTQRATARPLARMVQGVKREGALSCIKWCDLSPFNALWCIVGVMHKGYTIADSLDASIYCTVKHNEKGNMDD